MRPIQSLLTATTAAAAAAAAAAVLAAGCGTLDEASLEQEEGSCTSQTCTNSPEVIYGGFNELHLGGMLNWRGIRIRSLNGRAQIYQGAHAYDLEVVDGRIRGRSAKQMLLQGQALVGADIVLEHFPGGGPVTPLYAIHIHSVRSLPFPPYRGGTFEAYTFHRHDVGQHPGSGNPLCNRLTQVPPPRDHAEFFDGMVQNEAVVFEGDRIDPVALTMEQLPQPDWINFGCAGRTLAKLHVTGHSCLAQGPACPDAAAHESRQAALKLLTGDYCGTGQTFTRTGVPLLWQSGLFTYPAPPVDIEARWTSTGAACVGTPRLDAHTTPGQPTTLDLIAAECQAHQVPVPPSCTNLDVTDYDGASAVSANRMPWGTP